MANDSKTSSKKWYRRGAVVAASVALFFSLRGCVSGTTGTALADGRRSDANQSSAHRADDPQPDPNQPFANMNSAGNFVHRGTHMKPKLQIAAKATSAAILQAVGTYVNQLITTETQQLYSASQIQQGIAGATTAGASAYSAAIANGATQEQANQSAMVAAAQYLHNQGVMGPLICPVAMEMEEVNSGKLLNR